MQVETEDKVLKIGQETLENIAQEKKAKEDAAKTEDQKKAEALEADKQKQEAIKQQEEQKKQEVVNEELEDKLLDADEAQLNDEDKQKKKELEAQLEKETAEKRYYRLAKKTERRVGKLVSKLKALESASQQEKNQLLAEIKVLKSEVEHVKSPEKIEDLKKAEEAEINKLIAEDAEKPRDQRREMSKEELNDWLYEDAVAAHEWMVQRSERRKEDNIFKETRKQVAVEFINKQKESVKRLTEKFPGVIPADTRALELRNEGKSNEEIRAILMKENDNFRLCEEILAEHPEFHESEKLGDLLMAELEKRKPELKDKKKDEPKKKLFTEEELQERVNEAVRREEERLKSMDNSDRSTIVPKKKENEVKTPFLKQLEAEYVKAGLDPAKAKDRIATRAKIAGIENYNPANDKDED
jgi:hypothetical protein